MRFLYKKNKNAKISLGRRKELIKTVLEQRKSITYAAKKMRIKYSTARFIVHKYITTGVVQARPSLNPPSEAPQHAEQLESLGVDGSPINEGSLPEEENKSVPHQFLVFNAIPSPCLPPGYQFGILSSLFPLRPF